MRRALLPAALLAAGCGGGDGGGLSGGERDELAACARAMDAVGGAVPAGPPLEHALRYADACGAKVGGLDRLREAEPEERLQVLAAETDLVCAEAATELSAVEPARRWELLARRCGPGHYGLPPDQLALLSAEWFVIQRSAARAATLRERAVGDLAEEFDAAAKKMSLPLPLPVFATGVYQLPRATHATTAAPGPYVVVSSGRLQVGLPPVARASGRGARIVFPAGAAFPGAPVDLAKLPVEVDALVAAAPGGGVLLLADAASPAMRGLDVARLLAAHRPRFGLVAGYTLAAHLQLLGPGGTETGGEPGAQVILFLRKGRVDVVGGGEPPRPVPYLDQRPDRAELQSLLRQAADRTPGGLRVLLAAEPGPSVQDLVIVLDAVHGAGVDEVMAIDPDAQPDFAAPVGPTVGATTPAGPPLPASAADRAAVEEAIDARIRRDRAAIDACYRPQEAARAPARPDIKVTFVIDAAGKVTAARASGYARGVASCVAARIEAMDFPPPPGGAPMQLIRSFVLRPPR